MPEVVAPPAVVPTSRPNGTTPPPAATTTQPPPPEKGETDITAKHKALEAEFNKRTKSHVIERRQWERERETLKQQAARAAELEKRESHAKTNPSAYLKSLYGENWQQLVSEAGLTGSTPAQLVQESMDALRAEFEAKEKAREESAQKEREGAKSAQVEQARRGLFADAAAWYRAKASEYPILAKLGAETAVARTIANRIEAEFAKSHKTDESGNVLERGRVLTESEAADLIEAEVLEWVAEAGKHEKYKPKLQTTSDPANVSASKQVEKQPAARRSITNDITGSTSATKPPSSEKERRQRVLAAFEAARRKG